MALCNNLRSWALFGIAQQASQFLTRNVAINDVLPLKAAWRDATANLQWFCLLGPGDTSELFSIISFAFTTRRHYIRLAQCHLPPSVWQSLVGFRLLTSVSKAWQRSRTQKWRGVGKNFGPVLNHLWTKVHEHFRRCRRPLVLSDALARLSTSSLIHKIFAITSRSRRKTEQMYKVFDPHFLGGMAPTFQRYIVSTIYCPPFGKVWLSSLCWSPSAKPGNEVESRIYGRWVKTAVHFKLFVNQSWWHFETMYETPCSFQRTCPIMYIMFRSEDVGR